MMQELETTQGKEVTTRDEEIENIHAAAQADAGFEKILKVKKVRYLRNCRTAWHKISGTCYRLG